MKLRGIKKVCGQTKDIYPYGPLYLEVFYDRKTGEVYGKEMTPNSYTLTGEDSDWVLVLRTDRPMTMREIRQAVEAKIEEDWNERNS